MPSSREERARAALNRIPGLTWRPLERAELPAIVDLRNAAERIDQNPELTSLNELQEYMDSAFSRPEEDTLAAWDSEGNAVALAWAACRRSVTEKRRVNLSGVVHPQRRGTGIGSAILEWQVAHALAWDADTREAGFGPFEARIFAPASQVDLAQLAARFGFERVRHFYSMERELVEVPPRRSIPGISIVGWDPARSDEARTVVNAAFRDHWGSVERSPQMWEEIVGRAAFRADWSLLAVDEVTGKIAGLLLGAAYTHDWSEAKKLGYADVIGVLRAYRKRGIAGALLVEAMHLFASSGMTTAELDVDVENPSGALGLYTSLGFRETHVECCFSLQGSSAGA